MQETLYAIHPLLPDLKVNEDGTEVIWRGKLLKISIRNDERYKTIIRRVNFNGRTYRVSRLVCECWHGMGEVDQKVRKYDVTAGDHFNNLFWATQSEYVKNHQFKFITCKAKIQPEHYDNVMLRLKAGESMTSIAKSYNATAMAVHRVKKKVLAND